MALLKTRGVRVLISLFFVSLALFATEEGTIAQSISISGAYYVPNQDGYELNGNFAPISYDVIEASNENERDLGSTWGGAEIKATYKISLTEDFLTGGSALTKNNSIKYSYMANMTPVNVETGGEVSISPIAFLDFTLGTTITSGWKAVGVVGLGLDDENGDTNEDAFQGVLSQSKLSGTFKFDTAAVMSGDTTWKHILFLSSHSLVYRYFSAAGEDDSWVYQGTEANFNGFLYNTTNVVAYQMPFLLDMAGILVETKTNLFSNSDRSTIDDGGWGSDYVRVRFGGIFNLTFNENHSLAILPQFITRLHYTDDTISNAYFADRVVDREDPIYFDFDRVAINYSYKF